MEFDIESKVDMVEFEAEFDKQKGAGKLLYKVDEAGEYDQLHKFEPAAEIIAIPAPVGG